MLQSETDFKALGVWTRVRIHFIEDIVVHRYVDSTGADYDCRFEKSSVIPEIIFVWFDGDKLLFQYPDSADLLLLPWQGFEIKALYPIQYKRPPVLSSFRWYDC